jgi:hypothetical protein
MESASGQGSGSRQAPLRCEECGRLTGSDTRGWRGYRLEDPEGDESPGIAFYCPACAEREFGK